MDRGKEGGYERDVLIRGGGGGGVVVVGGGEGEDRGRWREMGVIENRRASLSHHPCHTYRIHRNQMVGFGSIRAVGESDVVACPRVVEIGPFVTAIGVPPRPQTIQYLLTSLRLG